LSQEFTDLPDITEELQDYQTNGNTMQKLPQHWFPHDLSILFKLSSTYLSIFKDQFPFKGLVLP